MSKIYLPNTIIKKIEFNYYELGPITDDSANKTVSSTVWTPLGSANIVLWEGDAYDSAGDWTQEEAVARISEIVSGLY
jgi:hypothetical protein